MLDKRQSRARKMGQTSKKSLSFLSLVALSFLSRLLSDYTGEGIQTIRNLVTHWKYKPARVSVAIQLFQNPSPFSSTSKTPRLFNITDDL